jgi:hypothetical protein
MKDTIQYKTEWTVRKYANDEAFQRNESFEEAIVEGNLLLNEGIAELWDLACGLGSPTAFSNANAYLGVGDSSTAESAAHTGLQASSNKAYVGMESGYPSRSGQTVTWRAVFGSAVANFAWNEFTVANGNSDSADNLNRKVSSQGTKASGQTWTLDLAITFS